MKLVPRLRGEDKLRMIEVLGVRLCTPTLAGRRGHQPATGNSPLLSFPKSFIGNPERGFVESKLPTYKSLVAQSTFPWLVYDLVHQQAREASPLMAHGGISVHLINRQRRSAGLLRLAGCSRVPGDPRYCRVRSPGSTGMKLVPRLRGEDKLRMIDVPGVHHRTPTLAGRRGRQPATGNSPLLSFPKSFIGNPERGFVQNKLPSYKSLMVRSTFLKLVFNRQERVPDGAVNDILCSLPHSAVGWGHPAARE
jgi:hypothetical protein